MTAMDSSSARAEREPEAARLLAGLFATREDTAVAYAPVGAATLRPVIDRAAAAEAGRSLWSPWRSRR